MITQLKKGSLELCVLALIDHKDCYGFEILEKISAFMEVSEGSIYPLLRRLTQEGYVETYFQESSEGPARKYYKLSSSGTDYYKESYKQWMEFHQQVLHLFATYHKEEEANESNDSKQRPVLATTK